MFGYATRETPELMPMPIALAHKLAHRLAEVRRGDVIHYLRPDGKTQVTVRYENGRPIEIEKILISTQHNDGVDADTLIRPDLWEHVVHPILPAELYDERKLNTKSELLRQPDRPLRDRRPRRRRRPHRAARSSSTRTGAPPATAAARSRARTRRRSTARPPTRRATSPRTSSRRASPTAARSRSPTRSASPIRSR